MIPACVFADCLREAQDALREGKPTHWVVAGVIVAVWLLLAGFAIVAVIQTFRK
jgi:hypothetical protein